MSVVGKLQKAKRETVAPLEDLLEKETLKLEKAKVECVVVVRGALSAVVCRRSHHHPVILTVLY